MSGGSLSQPGTPSDVNKAKARAADALAKQFTGLSRLLQQIGSTLQALESPWPFPAPGLTRAGLRVSCARPRLPSLSTAFAEIRASVRRLWHLNARR